MKRFWFHSKAVNFLALKKPELAAIVASLGRMPVHACFQIQEARGQHDDEAVKRALNEYEDTLGRYIPVLMAQAKIYWDLEMYQQVKERFGCILNGTTYL